MPELVADIRLTFRPSETLDARSVARFLGFASDRLLARFAAIEGLALDEARRTHHVTCRTTFDVWTGRPSYTLEVVRREEALAR